MDHCCSCIRDHCTYSAEVQLCDSASAASTAEHQAKKVTGVEANIPDDGHWIYRFDTRSPAEKLARIARAKKFYATLSHKLEAAEEEWHKAQPEDPELDWKLEEVGEFGQEGWTISYTHKSVKKD